jgi:hypothetical protein
MDQSKGVSKTQAEQLLNEAKQNLKLATTDSAKK